MTMPIEIAINIIVESWHVLAQMAPYLLFGFAAAGVLSILISPSWVERHLGSRGIMPVVKASLFGVPLPLCSCGVIPVAAHLRKDGAGKGPTISFLASTAKTERDKNRRIIKLIFLDIFIVYKSYIFLKTCQDVEKFEP